MLAYLHNLLTPYKKLHLLGLSFPLVWMHVISQNMVTDALDFQLAFHVGLCVCLATLALLYRRIEQTFCRLPFGIVAACAMCLVPLAGIIPATLPPVIELACAFASGAGIAYFFTKWFVIYSTFKTKDAYSYILISFSVSSLVRFLLALISLESTLPVLVIALVLPFLSLWNSQKAPFDVQAVISNTEKETHAAQAPSQRHTVFLVIQVFVYAAIFGNGVIFSILQNSIPGSTHEDLITLINFALRAAFTVLLLFWIASHGQTSQYRNTSNSLVLILVLVLVAFWFLGDSSLLIAFSVVSLARNLVIILLYLALIKLTHTLKRSAVLIFALGRCFYEISVACGILTYSRIGTINSTILLNDELIYPIAICVFVFLSGCFFATAQNLRDDLENPPVAEIDRASIALERTRIEYALSDREFDIMRLLYKGHSKKGIADTLCLSENTIRWHSQHLYKKLDIHSREDLLSVVDSRLDD